MDINKVYEHYQVHGTNWTIQRYKEMVNGRYRWTLFRDGEAVGRTSRHMPYESAMTYARKFIKEWNKKQDNGIPA